jgi:chromosome partitioning protein
MIVVFGSRKGGVGKTTLLCNLAVMMQKVGIKVVIVDGDPLQSATDWAAARGELERVEPVSVITASRAGKTLLKTIRELSDTYDHVLVDLAGVADENNSIVIGMADMVVSPFNASNLDLNSLPALDELLSKFREIRPALDIRYILNRIRHNIPQELIASRDYFKTFDLSPMQAVLHDRKAWRETMGMGLSVLESKDDKAAGEIVAVFAELFPHYKYDNNQYRSEKTHAFS